MTAAVAGGSRPGWPGAGSAPREVSPCAGSFAVARWLTGAMQGSFVCCDLEEEKLSKFVLPFEINFISASA